MDSTNLTAVLAAAGTGGANARTRIREASVRKRVVDAQIAATQADIKKIATQRKDSYELHAVLEASAAVSTTISVGYRIADASWHFLYDARLDTTSKRVALARQASVEQGSGENWGHVSLLADREPHLYSIGEDGFAVDLIARAVPSLSRSAFLEATFKFERDVPWAPGELQLYRDGAFVGSTDTPGLLPGANVRLPFGADDRIRIESHDEPAESGIRGLLGGQMVEEHRRRFDVTSFHGAPIVLELIDRVPVSQNAVIKVELSRDAIPPTTRDLDGKAGIVLWKLNLVPHERAIVKQHYAVGYPKGQRIEQSEAAAGS